MKLARIVLIRLTIPVALFCAWWLLSARSESIYWPPLSTILSKFSDTWLGPRFASDVVPSMTRLLGGYIAAVAIGILLGLLVGLFHRLSTAAEPVLEFFRALPPPVLVPILLAISGIGNTTKLSVIILGSLWPVLLNTAQGVQAIDPTQSETASSYRITGLRRIRYLVLPAASPQIMTGMRQSLSVAIILMVISEMMASTGGIGYSIIQFQRTFSLVQMWTGILLLGIIGVLVALLYRVIEHRVLSWYFRMRTTQQR